MADGTVSPEHKLLIENAVLHAKAEIGKMIDEKITKLTEDTKLCMKELPCDERGDAIKKNSNNLRTLVIVLVLTGALTGGGVGVTKLVQIILGG